MTCHAILINPVGVLTGNLCCNNRMDGSIFCDEHRTISPEDHKNRWIRKFLLGADGNLFLYRYQEDKKERILADLKNGVLSLTQDDINCIPGRSKYLDIYLLLFENGYIDLSKNHTILCKRALLYLSTFWNQTETSNILNLSSLAKRIVEVLILRDANHLRVFLLLVPVLLLDPSFQGEHLNTRMPSIVAFLLTLLESDAANQLSWELFEPTVLAQFVDRLGPEHPMTVFFRESYLPRFKTLYSCQKKVQKARMNLVKEELMAVAWHPDRFMESCLDEQEKAENRILFG